MSLAAPRLALISTGEDNTYGHPAPGTVGALRARGAAVLRTDRDGRWRSSPVRTRTERWRWRWRWRDTEGMTQGSTPRRPTPICAAWGGAARPAHAGRAAELHLRHLRTVPFENLSVHLGEVVIAAMEAARAEMPTGSIEQITTYVRWEYRHWDPEPITYEKGEVTDLEDFADDEIEWLDED